MITITKNYAEKIKQVCKMAASKSSMQSLENVLIKADKNIMTMTAGDGTVQMSISIECEVKSGGETTVNAGKLIAALNSCNFDCNIIFKDDAITVKSGRKRFNLSTLNADVYPAFPDSIDRNVLDISSQDLLSAIKDVSISCASNDVRFYLNGVFIGADAVGTDGHRLSVINIGLITNAVIPISAIKQIPDIDGDVYLSSNMIEFNSGDMVIKSKLIDGTYPDYSRAIQKPNKIATINIEELSDAVKSAMITSSTSSSAITMTIDDKCTIKSRSANDDSVIEIDIKSDDKIDMAFNAKYLVDALSFYTGDIDIGFSDNQLIIDNGGIKNIVMTVVA